LNGTIFNELKGEFIPHSDPADILVNKTTSESVQFYLSITFVNSLFKFIFDTGLLNVTLDNNLISTDDFNFTTTSFDPLLDGLVAKYGEN